MKQTDTGLTVADVFRAGFQEYVSKRKIVPVLHRKIASAIMDCRTEKLGGLIYTCEDCTQPVVLFHSCRNRHCPKCQAMARAAWVTNRQNELPQTDYVHVVFTIPPPLKSYAHRNKEVFYFLMFRAVQFISAGIGSRSRVSGWHFGYYCHSSYLESGTDLSSTYSLYYSSGGTFCRRC